MLFVFMFLCRGDTLLRVEKLAATRAPVNQ